MTGQRFQKAKYQRQLRRIEEELRQWGYSYARALLGEQPEWLQERYRDRYEQLLDVAHTVERARHDLDVLPRLS